MNLRKITILSILGASLFFVFWAALSSPQYGSIYAFKNFLTPEDSTTRTKSRRPTYQTEDRLGDQYNNKTNKSPLELQNPDNITEEVEIDTATGNYIVREKVGDMEYRTQTYLTFEEYYNYKNKQMLRDYWQHKDTTATPQRGAKPGQPFGFTKHVKGLEGPFGSNYVDIRPSGLVTLDFAGRWQRVNNPSLPIKQQRTGLFDFDQQISMNVIGKVGEKLKLTVNWDTKAAFEFQNSVKIQYTAFEEDIIQAIEVGRVNMPLNSSLMTGPQNLFGLKTKLQFGRLSVTAVAARQDGKLDEIKIGGGGQGRTFEIKADGYEPYRHFFLSQFFRANYEKSLKSSPTILSGIQVKRVDVYITNRNNTTANLRSVVGYLDLGESDSIYRDGLANPPPFGPKVPYNEINKLYNGANPVTKYRNAQTLDADLNVISQECGCDFQDGTDYTYLKSARKLLPTEFTFNPDLGYITLQTRLNEDEALLVAYQYTYNNEQYTVGEFQDDLTDIESTDLIIAKMIKPPVIKTHLPTWDLMMKNIYQLGVTQLQRDNFQFRIIYKDDATGLDIPNLQEGANTKNVPLLRLCGLDYLNPNNDPAPDGNFDYVEGVTVDSRNGRIMFPVLEPFGSNLESKFLPSETAYKQKYVFSELYDSTASDASQIASKNKYFFQGRYTAGTASEIMLPGINVAQGSVVVVAGSITLVEGRDYTVDYSLGRIKILNESVLASGQEIRIRFEKQDLFNFRRKSFLGTRLDYKVNDKILLGATMLHSNEAPNITRVNIGDEPAANTIWGLDANVKSTSRMLTRAVDLLPVVSTKAPSNISFQGEFAQFLPGYNKILDKNGTGEGGIAFIDDFEGAKTPYDLTRSPLTWTMAATPQRMQPDADSTGLPNGYRRARLAWYNIDNIFYRSNNGLPAYLDYSKITNHFERNITQLELFPNQDLNVAVTNIPTLDLAFYPAERGAYNFTDNMNPDGTLKNPTSNWGGITKAIKNNIDFDNANIQYIEFWLLSPFIDGANGHTKIDGVPFDQTNTGYLYFNLGSISEDVLPDNLQSYENGLPTDGSNTGTTPTTWGRVSTKQYITNAFDNDPASRPYQDVGLDGLGDTSELNKFANRALAIESVVTPAAYAGIKNDLCADNFEYYLGSAQDIAELTILQRYKHFNLTQNNSPINNGASITPSSSNYPDNEDLNQDNNLNTLEEYYEYKIKIDKNEFQIGKNYIVSSRELTITASDGTGDDVVTWYQFRVPIRTPDSIVGNIQGFKSIKWMRTYVTGFKSPVVLRMAQFQLVANQWRPYNLPDLQGPNLQNRTDESVIDLSVVNVEENSTSNGGTTPYILPPNFQRDYDATSVTTRRTNEQSLRLCIDGLQDGSIRAAYKNVNLNLMNYEKVEMFIHAESENPPSNGEAYALFRLGTDYTNNYYEVQVPLHFTKPITSTDPDSVWHTANTISVNITDLVNAKLQRNNSGASQQASYRVGPLANGHYIVVVGNPDLSAVVTLMIGLKNPIGGDANPMKFCIWTDELRASGFNSHSSIAYAANLSANLADLGTVNGSIRYTSAGFGSLDQKVSQRERANTLEYGLNTQLAMEKFIPGKTGLKVPLYLGYNRKVISPQYDPLNPDVTVAESVNAQGDPKAYRNLIIDQQATKAINLAGLQKTKVNPASKKHIYDVENLMLTLGYTQTTRSSYDIKKMEYEKYNGTFAYNFSNAAKSYTPLKSMKQTKGMFTPLFKDFNFALMPSQIGFKADLIRELRTTQYYQSNPKEGLVQDPIYAKSFTFTRNYSFLWNLTKSATLTYRADAGALIDEPNRAPGGQEYKDSIMSNLLRMGRLKTFDQTYTINYKVPLDKVKILNWTSMDYTYGAGYTWTAGALGLRDSLGNTIKNKQDNTLNAKVDLDKLYSKSKFLMEMKKPKPPLKKPDPKDTIPPPPNRTLLKAAFKTLMMIRNANLAYTNAQYTSMGGFMETPKYLGFSSNQNMGIMAPFIFGSQNADFRTDAAAVGWISTASSINSLFTQSTTQNLTGRMNIEPIKDFKIVLEAKYSKTNLYEERFRSIDGTINGFVSGNPTLKGNYSISTITILTAFDKHISGSKDPNSSANFEKFTEYRAIMDARLGGKPTDYTETSQSVLFPAFLAAYAGLDPNKVNISGIPRIPLPGWQVDYTGLARSKALAKKFQSITISHKYSSQYAVGSFASQTIYTSEFVTPTSNFYDTGLIPTETNASGQIVPIYIMTGVMVTESFAPFIGINARTKNKITYRVTYNRTRILNMSMSNAQLTESYNNSWQVGIGFARSNVKIPKFLTGGTQKFLKNELNIQVNFNINDMITYQRKFLDNATVTSGNTNIQFKPTVSYNMSQRVTMMLYFERTINSPKISSSYRRATTSIGVQVRFTLS